MRFVGLGLILIASSVSGEVVRSVSLQGTDAHVQLATQVGQDYDSAVIDKDVKALWSTGRFSDIRVKREEREDGTAVIFDVVETQTQPLHEMRIEPSTFGVQFKIPEGTPMDRVRAHEAVRRTLEELRAEGFQNAEVDYKLTPYIGRQVNLTLTVDPGQRVRVKQLDFTGDVGLNPKDLRAALQALRIRRVIPPIPGLWSGWRLFPAYSPDAVQSDLGRVQSLYISKGYLDVSLRLDDIKVNRGDANIAVHVDAGPQYSVAASSIDGVAADVTSPGELCPSLFSARREAEKQGIPDFSAKLDARGMEPSELVPAVDLAVTTEKGRSYHIGRIDFSGRQHFSDAIVRSNMLLAEGDLLDEKLLRKSMMRINQTGYFDPVTERDVHIQTDEDSGIANIDIQLHERKGGAWSLSGPVGPASIGGPLEANIRSRLPAWGSGLFELSTYSAALSLYAFLPPLIPAISLLPKGTIVPIMALQRPFVPGEGWRSGFLIAPQLGWQALGAIYAVTQIQQRLLPKLAGDRGLIPELPVTVETHKGEAMMYCEPAPPRMAALRTGASFALRFLGVFTGL
ncbi:MAG TPA: POTRA domain-containing protein [Bryobacteraceae bacterium]|nr:POTRA domain-containing protein [Bryobacteraceae bacterium]